jgi:hypothetical protein
MKMKKVVFVLSLFSMHSAFAAMPIIGGQPVAASDFISKSVVAFVSTSSQGQALCTASLVAEDLAITAAHCVKDSSPAPQAEFVLIFGNNIKTAGVVTRMVDKVEIPSTWKPNAQPALNTSDVALLHFAGGLPSGYVVSDILPFDQMPKNGDEVTLAGYGITNGATNFGAGLLRKVQVKVLNANFSATEIEFDESEGGGACNGDSGGPAYVMVNNHPFLFALTSRGGSECNQDVIYTKISAYADWFTTASKAIEAK